MAEIKITITIPDYELYNWTNEVGHDELIESFESGLKKQIEDYGVENIYVKCEIMKDTN